MPPVTVTLVDDAEKTVTQTTDSALGSVTTTTVWKPGTLQFNSQAIANRVAQTIDDANTLLPLLNANGWDGLTPAQRKAAAIGWTEALKGAARLLSNRYDSSS